MGSTAGLRPFKPGQSGNPGGRPKHGLSFRNKCQDFMDAEGWAHLASLARGRSKDAFPALSLIAAYAYGKPSQPITGEDGGPVQFAISALVADIRREAERALLARVSTPALGDGDVESAEAEDTGG